MKWSLQAAIATQNAKKMANWVFSVFLDRSKDVLFTLDKSIVRSRLEYSCPVKKIGLISLQRRRERYVILHMCKIWQGAVPNDLDIQFYDYTRLGTRCKIPQPSQSQFTITPLPFVVQNCGTPSLMCSILRGLQVQTDIPPHEYYS